jgi:hypothetical protein
MKRRIGCLALTAALLAVSLTGCGKSGETKAGLYYDTTGISPDAVLLSVDGWDVTAQRYLYWLTYNCDYISGYYQQAGKTVDWGESHNGQTLAEYVMQQALNTSALYAEIESWAKQYGCEISEEDLSGIENEWEAACQQAGGEDAYLAQLAYMGIDKGTAELTSADYYLYDHLYELYNDESSELHPTQAALDQYTQEQGFLTVDEIWVSTADVADGDTTAMQEKRERAEMILGKLNGSSDPMEYFETLAGTYTDETNRDDYPNGFTFAPGSGVMPEAFETAAKALAENTWSDVIETEQGFYIILRKPLDTDTVSSDYFDKLLKDAANSAEITYSDAYQTLDVADFYQKLTDARTDMKVGPPTGGSSAFSAALPGASSQPDGGADTSVAN